MDDRMKHNNGFTLIEIIVAVLIMGILSATAVASVSTVHNAKVSSASSVFGNVMKVARDKAMGLENKSGNGISDVYLLMYIKNGNVYADTYQIVHDVKRNNSGTPILDEHGNTIEEDSAKLLRTEKLSNDHVSITFKNHNRTTLQKTLAQGKMIKVFFKKSTGGIQSIMECDSNDDTSFSKDVNGVAYDSITDTFADTVVFQGPSEKKTIVICSGTGRCYLGED